MKLVRKVKKTILYIDMTDPQHPKGFEKVEYEDVIEDSLFKKIIKSWITYLLLFCLVATSLGVIYADKWSAILNMHGFYIWAYIGYNHYKSLKG